MVVKDILKQTSFTKQDAIKLLEINNTSCEFYDLLSKANAMSRNAYAKGHIFVQIGIDTGACSGNCKFCSIAKDNIKDNKMYQKSIEEIETIVKALDFNDISAVFLMTTADFNKNKFIEIATAVKKIIPSNVDLVANIGDFDISYAEKLKETGFTAVYHIVRLREGIDTDISVETRLKTLNAITQTGLKLFYCIEPIGVEHTYEEIVEEMFRAKELNVDVMAVMSRVPVAGTPYENIPEVDDLELSKIVAVTRIVVDPKISMNLHEPKAIATAAGVNQLYAEIGVNPRDIGENTELTKGYTVEFAKHALQTAQYIVGENNTIK